MRRLLPVLIIIGVWGERAKGRKGEKEGKGELKAREGENERTLLFLHRPKLNRNAFISVYIEYTWADQ